MGILRRLAWRYRTIRACSFPCSRYPLAVFPEGSLVRAYHCDRDRGRIGEDEGHLVKLAAAAPVLCEGHPGHR